MAGCFERIDETLGSGAMELSMIFTVKMVTALLEKMGGLQHTMWLKPIGDLRKRTISQDFFC
jgi:hypothetical protein